ncbi:MAG: efflux RND transporter periplasmic adaptor subunit [Lachnospiraceae bacterium]
MKGFSKKGVKWFAIVVFIIMAAAGIIIFAINKKSTSYVQADNKRAASIVLKKMDLTKSISATGKVKSGSSKTVSAQLNGVKVKKVNVLAGDKVKKGDTLVEFDTKELEESLADAEENLTDVKEDYSSSIALAQKKLDDAKSTYNSDKKNLEEKISDLKNSLENVKKQVKELKKKAKDAKNAEEKMSFTEQLSKAEESKKNIKNEYETAKNNKENTNKQNKSSIDNASEALRTAESNGKRSLKEAKKQVKEAKKQLSYSTVKAAANGTVTAVYVENGDIYNGGDIAQIDNISSFKVVTSVDEYDISSISKGQKVIILTAATGEDGLEGEITFVAPSATSTGSQETNSSESSGYEVEIGLNTRDKRLRMGMTARCSIILEEAEDVYAVPYDAVHENQDGKSVIYVEDTKGMGDINTQEDKTGRTGEEAGQDSMTQKEIEVTKGMENDYYVEISGSGLSEGLRVIIKTDSDVSSEDEGDKQETNGIDIPGMGNKMPGEDMPSGRIPGGNMQGGGSFRSGKMAGQ